MKITILYNMIKAINNHPKSYQSMINFDIRIELKLWTTLYWKLYNLIFSGMYNMLGSAV